MQVTVNIPDAFVAQVKAQGLTPEAYLERLVAEQSERLAGSTSGRQDGFAASMDALTKHSAKIPSLPIEAFSRESIYSDTE